MSNYAYNRVVVGVDDTAERQPVLKNAAAEARRLNAGLTVMHVFDQPVALGMAPWPLGFDQAVQESTAALEQLVTKVRAENPDLDVRSVLVVGSPAYVLVEASREAKLVVLGCRGMGGFAELLLGSVSAQTATHSHCPVLVLRPAAAEASPSAGPVLVGVDGSSASTAAIEFAFAEADARRTGLVALHCWAPAPTLSFTQEYAQAELDADGEAARVLLAKAIADWAQTYPDVTVEQRVVLDAAPESIGGT
ncbi:nucleotide-binding universal stress UspA family protein [Allocatelliglobosispora scoriae]|uniref:Nucleotide-binding universal stress UspA family protein n=1 Tax=Allocatelliglobosispora scoriae TaxID=643052 RepID=A0A841BKK1_9ACTN|nr:universal stress protein [Allocatelliglobosispora scoriae]MBB5867391.1 nucleotide-binding universal stress UspA family protein [Allocatelliglobosispora scoriae]